MKYLLLLLPFLAVACTPKPEPLRYGQDGCFTCKMTLTDKKYGCEVVTNKGKVFKFDDLNCMLNFLHSGYVEESEWHDVLVRDYSHDAAGLIPAMDAHYVLSDELRTPMGSRVAAFRSADSMKVYKKSLAGIYLTWGEVRTQFK